MFVSGLAVRLHHALAAPAPDYTKKLFVFRLRTADRAEFLFQTSDQVSQTPVSQCLHLFAVLHLALQAELESWVETINTVVARYSSPALPAPCSSSVRFQRPLFPSSPSRASLSEQLALHRQRSRELGEELSLHTARLVSQPTYQPTNQQANPQINQPTKFVLQPARAGK